jgi:hypothetical protein
VSWVLDADIRGFFDAIDHEWLVKFIEHRVGDRRVLRLIQKWLSAGVMEKGKWTESTVGSPQGATVTPPTQLTKVVLTRGVAGIISRFRWAITAGCRRHAVDDGRSTFVNLDACHERANELALLEPVEVVDTRDDACREIVEARGDDTQLDVLSQIGLRSRELFCRGSNSGAYAFAALGQHSAAAGRNQTWLPQQRHRLDRPIG